MIKVERNLIGGVSEIFGQHKFADSRLETRLNQIIDRVSQRPDASFPSIFMNKAELDGFYRFVNNRRIEPESFVKSACDHTVSQVEKGQTVLAIHDSTSFKFPTQSSFNGLGRVTNKTRGFFGHFCIGVSENREILGLLGLYCWARTEKRKGKRSRDELLADKTNEGLKWGKVISEAQERLSSHANVIHVADREADDYANIARMVKLGIRFIIRSNKDRRILDEEHTHLRSSLKEASVQCTREIVVSERKKAKITPFRKSRVAELGIAAKSIEIRRTIHAHANKEVIGSIVLNFVRVFELNPPDREVPIEWILMTTEPIVTSDDLLRVVDAYRMRWTIEEYFKALKTGFSFEKRRLDSLHALLNCLAIFAPIACKVYNLKLIGIQAPNSPSLKVLTATQIRILEIELKKNEGDLQTLSDAMLAVAQLGGHLKYKGPPGWQVLGRGYEMLLQLEHGWKLAQQVSHPSLMPSNM